MSRPILSFKDQLDITNTLVKFILEPAKTLVYEKTYEVTFVHTDGSSLVAKTDGDGTIQYFLKLITENTNNVYEMEQLCSGSQLLLEEFINHFNNRY